MPYVYQHFKWDHCKALGYDIAAINTTNAGSVQDIMNSVLPNDGNHDDATPIRSRGRRYAARGRRHRV